MGRWWKIRKASPATVRQVNLTSMVPVKIPFRYVMAIKVVHFARNKKVVRGWRTVYHERIKGHHYYLPNLVTSLVLGPRNAEIPPIRAPSLASKPMVSKHALIFQLLLEFSGRPHSVYPASMSTLPHNSLAIPYVALPAKSLHEGRLVWRKGGADMIWHT